MSRLRSDQGGFTLLEVLVAMTVSMLVFGATLTVYSGVQKDYRRTEEHNDAQLVARHTVDRLARELRNLAAPTDFSTAAGTFPNSVEKNDRYDFVFKVVDDSGGASAANPVGVMRVRYCLDESDPKRGLLWRQEQSAAAFTLAAPASGACPANSGWTRSTIAAQHVVNRLGGMDRPIFTYATDGALIPYNSPDAITDTTRVETNVYVDPTPDARPNAAQLSSSVLLRNQNRRPEALFTVTVSGRTVELNGTESKDPENERLSYEWYEDGVLKEQWLDPVVRVTYPTAGIHSYKLVVRDPALLHDESQTQTVNLP